jgi:LEA14-like dessication related protein
MFKHFLLAILTFTLFSCSSLGNVLKKNIIEPEVKYKSMSIGSISSQGIELKPIFKVVNKNKFNIPLDNLSYQLAFNELTMLDGKVDNVGTLGANSTKDVPISIMLNKQVLAAFKELLLNDDKLQYLVKGEAKVLGLSIPFEKKGTFYRPKISLGNLDIGKSNFQLIQTTININIENPNDFSLPLESFNYKVSTGSHSLLKGELTSTELKQGMNAIKIPLSFKPEELFSSIFSLLRDPNLPLNVQIDSPLISINESITLNLKDLISL